jgi:hypothetical protein
MLLTQIWFSVLLAAELIAYLRHHFPLKVSPGEVVVFYLVTNILLLINLFVGAGNVNDNIESEHPLLICSYIIIMIVFYMMHLTFVFIPLYIIGINSITPLILFPAIALLFLIIESILFITSILNLIYRYYYSPVQQPNQAENNQLPEGGTVASCVLDVISKFIQTTAFFDLYIILLTNQHAQFFNKITPVLFSVAIAAPFFVIIKNKSDGYYSAANIINWVGGQLMHPN